MTAPVTFVGSETWEYLPGRTVNKGDLIRISGGPVWKDAQGALHRVGEKPGVYKFCCYAVDAKQQPFVLLCDTNGGGSYYVPLVVRRSRLGVRGWINRPYRFAKVRTK